jgi:hypothetical protein
MHDGRFLAVKESKCVGDLIRPPEHLFFTEKLFASTGVHQESAKVLAGHVIHNDIIARTVRENIRDFRQVGMVKTRKNSGLAQELFAGLLSYIFREGVVVFDFLQGALASLETLVVGKVNGSHAAFSDAFSNFIAATQYLLILEGWEQWFSLIFLQMRCCALCRCFGVVCINMRVSAIVL